MATQADANLLAGLDLTKLDSELASDRDEVLSAFCHALGKNFDSSQWQLSLFEALSGYPPLNLLVNQTMKQALPVKSLGEEIFQDSPQVAARALTALTRLGSLARRSLHEPGLLPCRVHSFYRGLPGLWVCMDPNCTASEQVATRPVGRMFAQPRDLCDCGLRVLELYTCRSCGTAYARAYTDDVQVPTFLWGEAGSIVRSASGEKKELEPIDLLLEEPVFGLVEPADYDLVTEDSIPRIRALACEPYFSEKTARYRTKTTLTRAQKPIQSRASSNLAPSAVKPLHLEGVRFRIIKQRVTSRSRLSLRSNCKFSRRTMYLPLVWPRFAVAKC